jgi:hypothetical protein
MRLLVVVAFAAAVAAISFAVYMAPPSSGNAPAVANPSAETGTARSPSRADSGHSDADGDQMQASVRNPGTPPVQHLSGATIMRCHHALLGKKSIQESLEDDCNGIEEGDDVGMQLCRQALVSDHAYLHELTARAADCPESLARAADYYEALRAAALAGDINAQACFLNGEFGDRHTENVISQEQLDDFLPLARGFVQDAIERGDWGIVHRLAERPEDMEGYGLLVMAYPFGPGYPDTLYKMNYLLTLGARDGKDSEATNLVNSYRKNGELSAEQIRVAEKWARETYDRYFAATPYSDKKASRLCKAD